MTGQCVDTRDGQVWPDWLPVRRESLPAAYAAVVVVFADVAGVLSPCTQEEVMEVCPDERRLDYIYPKGEQEARDTKE